MTGSPVLLSVPMAKRLRAEVDGGYGSGILKRTTSKAVIKGFTGSGASGGGIAAVAFSPDGRFLASGSGHGDRKIQVWYGGRTHKVTLTGHREGITSIAFHRDSRTLASGSRDHTVRLWDIVSGTHKMTLTGHTGRGQQRCVQSGWKDACERWRTR